MKIRILSVVLCLILASAVLAGCSKKDPAVPEGMKLASDPGVASYTLFVPEGWNIDMQTASTRAYCSGSDKSFVMVMTGELEHTDTTVADWWDAGLSELKALFPDFELVSREKATLDGREGEKFIYTGTFDETPFKYTQIAATKAGVIYVLTYGATQDRWDSHLDEITDVIDNFRFG